MKKLYKRKKMLAIPPEIVPPVCLVMYNHFHPSLCFTSFAWTQMPHNRNSARVI